MAVTRQALLATFLVLLALLVHVYVSLPCMSRLSAWYCEVPLLESLFASLMGSSTLFLLINVCTLKNCAVYEND